MNLNWVREHEAKPYQGDKKQGYTLTYIPDLKSLLLFGGDHTARSHDIHLYNIAKKQWTGIKTTSPKPEPRKHHTAHYQKSIRGLVIFGGEAEKGRSLDTFDVLFFQDWKWRKLSFKEQPAMRELHTFTPISNQNFLIFGGVQLPYGKYLHDLWILKGLTKIKHSKTLQIPGCTCAPLVGKGSPPPGRFAHRAYFHSQTFYVLGGQTQSQQQNFTVYSINMRSLNWHKTIFNINLAQIMKFSILQNPTDINQIYIFGGITIQNKVKKQNKYIYTMSFEKTLKLKKLEKLPNEIDFQVFNCCCELPFNQVLAVCWGWGSAGPLMYRVEVLASQEQRLELQEYLKYIKNEQLLSQQLLHKSTNLQCLYQQIQTYISKLFKQYQESQQYDQQIEQQKKRQIQYCIGLKSQYLQIEELYERNIEDLRIARRELSEVNRMFEGCIETERDEDMEEQQ